MLRERRKNRRFDTAIVVEFKALKKSLNSYLGITRDFSCDGFSFDSQSSWVEPGDDLELTFKNPQNGSYFSGLGEIVWKKKANSFECITGIRFKKIEDTARNGILEMASTAGDIPRDRILCKKDGKNIHIKKNNFRLYAAIIIIASFLSLVTAPLIFEDTESEFKPPAAAPSVTEPVREVETEETVPAPDEIREVKTEYYIQAGAWKNPEYAGEMFAKIKQHYPEAYIVVINNFQIIRIPGIEDRKQGAVILEDIEAELNLNPILVKNQR